MSSNDITFGFNIYKVGDTWYTGNRTDDTYVFSRIFEECKQALCRESEVFKCQVWVDRKGRAQEKALCTEEAVQVLQVPYVQAGGQGAKRTWQDLYYLSEVPGAVCET